MKTRVASAKLAIVLAVCAAASALLISGCTSTVGEDVTKRLDDLESRVTALEDDVKDKASGNSDSDATVTTYSDMETYDTYSGYLYDLNKRVNEAVTTSEGVIVPSDSSQCPLAFQNAVAPLRDLEDELDQLEDSFIAASVNGVVTNDELTKLKADADAIEGDIDVAIDSLKARFETGD